MLRVEGLRGDDVADIEQAAGLAPGAGGTYRHFPSKQAILEAVVDAIVGAPDDELAPPSRRPREDRALVARAT